MKKQYHGKCLLLAWALLFLHLHAGAARYEVYGLTCENFPRPVGVESSHPRFSWKLLAEQRNTLQTAYELEVYQDRQLVWASGKRQGESQLYVPYEGKPLQSATRYEWRVRSYDNHGNCSPWSDRQPFTTALLAPADWQDAKWIALEKDQATVTDGRHLSAAYGDARTKLFGHYRMPLFRRVIRWDKPIRQAVAYVSGLGHFELMLNGRKQGRRFLDPGWSNYNRQALYVAFDLTDSLKSIASRRAVLGVMLGNGFYNIPTERYFKLSRSNGAPKLRLKLVIRYEDGTTATVVSDKNWKTCAGPITFSSIYGGEDYDARREQRGWASDAGFDDSRWQKPVIAGGYHVRMKAQLGARMELAQRVDTRRRYKNGHGRWVYDLGQNFGGVVSMQVRGKQGCRIVLVPGELLNADSTVNQDATGKPFSYSYTCGGQGTERFAPRFTYYGQRYVEVEGAVPAGTPNPDGLPEIDDLCGYLSTSAGQPAGQFVCSKPLFNQIHTLIDWAIRSNIASVITDCPHREKLGWQEQDNLMQHSINYRYNTAPIYEKLFDDQLLAQRHDSIRGADGVSHEGCMPSICPEYVRFSDGFEDSPEWGSSCIISPWYNYLWYGDLRSIRDHYASMMAYLGYLDRRAKDNLLGYGLGDWFDIGPKAPGYAQLTSQRLTCTATYYYCTRIMGKCASLLGYAAEADRLLNKAEAIRQAYNRAFYHPETGLYENGSQTAQAMSLYMGLVDEANRGKVAARLAKSLRDGNYALTAGDIGYRYLLQALTREGYGDVVFKMNSKYDTPGYGWQIAHGATALTESWQAYGFVSNNHLMLGHLMEWLYAGLGGITQQDGSVAFRTVRIAPQVVGDISYADVSYESSRGTIRCGWKIVDGRFVLDVDIPAGCEAVVCLPAGMGGPAHATPHGELKVGSGHYHFEVGQ